MTKELYMKSIAEILPENHIVLDMEAGSKKRLFEEVARLLAAEQSLPEQDVFECLFARERLGTTGLGQGVAIPHGRHACIQETVGVFVRLKEGIDFDAPDGKPVSLVFVLLVPASATGEHLEILAHLAECFSDKNVRAGLMAAQSAQEARSLLLQ